VHAIVFRFVIGILVYICINLSRKMLLGALTRVFWRALTPGGFNFLASCTRTGKLAVDQQQRLIKQVRMFESMCIRVLLLIANCV